jgi:tetratricopeptide (TPR) repeat protein
LAAADQAVELAPDSGSAHYHRGSALAKLRRIDEAVEQFDAAFALDDRLVDAMILRSVVLYLSGRTKDALGAVNDALQKVPDNSTLRTLHDELLDARAWELVEDGTIEWSGGRPSPPAQPVDLGPGPSLSQLILESRE